MPEITKKSQGTRHYKPKKLDEVDYYIIQLLLDNPCMKDADIEKAFNGKMGKRMINRRRNNPTLQKALEEPLIAAQEIIMKKKVRAAHILGKLLSSTSERIQLDASRSMLENELKKAPIVSIDLSGWSKAWDKKLEDDAKKETEKEDGS